MEEMVDVYLSTKFGVNSLHGFQEKTFCEGRTGAQATALALLTQSSRAINKTHVRTLFIKYNCVHTSSHSCCCCTKYLNGLSGQNSHHVMTHVPTE